MILEGHDSFDDDCCRCFIVSVDVPPFSCLYLPSSRSLSPPPCQSRNPQTGQIGHQHSELHTSSAHSGSCYVDAVRPPAAQPRRVCCEVIRTPHHFTECLLSNHNARLDKCLYLDINSNTFSPRALFSDVSFSPLGTFWLKDSLFQSCQMRVARLDSAHCSCNTDDSRCPR